MSYFFISIAFVACVSLSSFAQQNQPTPDQLAPPQKPGIATETTDRHISLDVVVIDKAGNSVPGLQQQDFTLLDDKEPRAVASFHASDATGNPPDPPVQVIFLIDAVNSSFRGVSQQRLELEKFFRQNEGKLPLPMSFIVLTDKQNTTESATSRDGNSLANALDSSESGLRIIGRSQGFYGAAERFQMSIHTLEGLITYESAQPGRKLLIWLSAGWPLLTGPRIDLTAKDQAAIFSTVVALSKSLREARVTLYSINAFGVDNASLVQTFYYESFLKGVKSANKVESANLALQVLAVQSGGMVLNRSNDVGKLIAICVADAHAFYTLSFDSPPADNPNEYHSLEIKIDKPGLKARTRTGYYAQR
jgi:VWFA-related protein